MTCLFCRVISGDEPAHIVFEDDVAIAFLDVRPVFFGHTLVIPKAHHKTLADLPADLVDPLFQRVRRMSDVVTAALGAQGTFVAMNNTVSQSVPHLHVHVVPRTKGDGLRGFFWPRRNYDDEAHAAGVAETLRHSYEGETMR